MTFPNLSGKPPISLNLSGRGLERCWHFEPFRKMSGEVLPCCLSCTFLTSPCGVFVCEVSLRWIALACPVYRGPSRVSSRQHRPSQAGGSWEWQWQQTFPRHERLQCQLQMIGVTRWIPWALTHISSPKPTLQLLSKCSFVAMGPATDPNKGPNWFLLRFLFLPMLSELHLPHFAMWCLCLRGEPSRLIVG